MKQHAFEVMASHRIFVGRVAAMRPDQVSMPGGGTTQRVVVELPGAIGTAAMD